MWLHDITGPRNNEQTVASFRGKAFGKNESINPVIIKVYVVASGKGCSVFKCYCAESAVLLHPLTIDSTSVTHLA